MIDAHIDHGQKTLITREVINLYTSNEPQEVFHKRIKFCMELYNKCVQGMKFVSKEDKTDPFDFQNDDKNNDIEVLADLLDDLDDM